MAVNSLLAKITSPQKPANWTRLKLRLMGFSRKDWELKNIYRHHPESKKQKSSEWSSGSIHPYGRYGNAGKTGKTISTIAILLPVKAIFKKRAATVEVDTLISPERRVVGASLSKSCSASSAFLMGWATVWASRNAICRSDLKSCIVWESCCVLRVQPPSHEQT